MDRVQPIIRKKYADDMDQKTFDDTLSSYTWDYLDISAYQHFTFHLEIAWVGAPTNITLEVTFSGDQTVSTKYVNGPFGSLVYVPAQGDIAESISGNAYTKFITLYAIATGVDALNTITVTPYFTFST